MFGTWKLDSHLNDGVELPENVKTAFIEATRNLLGAKIVPVLYLGYQIVNGTNHMLLCTSTPVVSAATSSLVKVIINVSPGGERNTLLSIDPIA